MPPSAQRAAGGPLASPLAAARPTPADPSILIYVTKVSESCQIRTYDDPDDISEENEEKGIQGFPDRLKRFGRRHERALQMASFCEAKEGGKSRAKRLRDCGRYLVFRHYFTEDKLQLHDAKFCQQFKLCPLCAVARGAKMLRRYVECVLLRLAERPDLKLYMITHTAKNRESLPDMVQHVLAGLRFQQDQRRRRLSDFREPWTEFCKSEGAVGSVEVKRGRGSKLWHVHFHDAWMCAEEPDQDRLRREWKETTGDSHVVDVEPFHYVQRGEPGTKENVAADFCEVFKYCVKMQGLSLEDNWQVAQDLHGRRLVRSHGALWGVKMPDDLLDEPLEKEDLPYMELFYRFKLGEGYKLEHSAGDLGDENFLD